jgi:hypothetical protein
MEQELPPDAEVEGWLKTLGADSLCQWDVLFFLYRHQTSLLGAEYIARLLGYADGPVVAALDGLESLSLVERSRVSQNVRLYQFTVPPEAPRRAAFGRLVHLAGRRGGRLRLPILLRRDDRTPPEGLEAARRFPERAQQVGPEVRKLPHTNQEGSRPWLNAI